MSEGPELSEHEALAAEHALGVLTGAERAEAEALAARDPAFAALVDTWRERLSPLIRAAPDVQPPPGLWARIERSLPANDNATGVRFWRRAAFGSMGLLAASLAAVVFLASQTPVDVGQPVTAPMLNARLAPAEGGQPLFVAAYDPTRQALVVTSMVPPGTDPAHAHELWLIPADGKPRSLGLVEPGTSRAVPMPEALVPMASEGAALAVSVEPPGGSPTGDAPSGPIAAMGKFTRL